MAWIYFRCHVYIVLYSVLIVVSLYCLVSWHIIMIIYELSDQYIRGHLGKYKFRVVS